MDQITVALQDPDLQEDQLRPRPHTPRLRMHITIHLPPCSINRVTRGNPHPVQVEGMLDFSCKIVYFVEIVFDSYGVASSPSDALALTNCLIVHPSDFSQGQHVLVNGSYALTVRFV